MKVVEIVRLEDNPQYGTFGVLRIQKQIFCVTLEPPDYDNTIRISCIPAKQYTCRKYSSPRFRDTYAVLDVPNRSGILFHAGNSIIDTEGCIILAEKFGKLGENRAILNSGQTFEKFMTEMINDFEFSLTILKAY